MKTLKSRQHPDRATKGCIGVGVWRLHERQRGLRRQVRVLDIPRRDENRQNERDECSACMLYATALGRPARLDGS